MVLLRWEVDDRGLILSAHRFQPTDTKPGEITLSWTLPEDRRNGVVLRVAISWRAENAPGSGEASFELEAGAGTVRGLTPGVSYVFRGWAETAAGAGEAREWRQRTPIGSPPVAGHAVPAAVMRAATALSVRYRSDYFRSDNGNVTAYTLIVAEEPRLNTSAPLPSWQDVQHLAVWPPYQVSPIGRFLLLHHCNFYNWFRIVTLIRILKSSLVSSVNT